MAFRGLCTGGGDGATGGSLTAVLTLPAAAVAGDTIIFSTGQNGVNATCSVSGIASPLSGPDDSAGANARSYLFGKTLTAGDISAGSITATWTIANRSTAAGVVLIGGVLGSVVVGAVGKSTSANPSMPSVVSVTANNDIIGLTAIRVASGVPPTITWPAGYTTGNQAKSNTGTINVSSAAGYLTTPGAAGTYGGGATTMAAATSALYTVAVPPTVFSGTLGLSGSGTLSQAGTPAIPGTLALSGSGSMTDDGTPSPTASMALSGDGALALAGTPAVAGTLALSGAGTLVEAGVPAIGGTLALSGGGSLALAGAPSIPGVLGLSGVGTLTLFGAIPAVPPELVDITGPYGLTVIAAGPYCTTMTAAGPYEDTDLVLIDGPRGP